MIFRFFFQCMFFKTLLKIEQLELCELNSRLSILWNLSICLSCGQHYAGFSTMSLQDTVRFLLCYYFCLGLLYIIWEYLQLAIFFYFTDFYDIMAQAFANRLSSSTTGGWGIIIYPVDTVYPQFSLVSLLLSYLLSDTYDLYCLPSSLYMAFLHFLQCLLGDHEFL